LEILEELNGNSKSPILLGWHWSHHTIARLSITHWTRYRS